MDTSELSLTEIHKSIDSAIKSLKDQLIEVSKSIIKTMKRLNKYFLNITVKQIKNQKMFIYHISITDNKLSLV